MLFIFTQAKFSTGSLCTLAAALEIRVHETVTILARDSGNLDETLQEWFSPDLVKILDIGSFPYSAPFSDRVRAAREILIMMPSDLVWVDGFTASDFALASKLEGRKVVLQSYHEIKEIIYFLQHDLTKRDLGKWLDGLILPNVEYLKAITTLMDVLPQCTHLRLPQITPLRIEAGKNTGEWRVASQNNAIHQPHGIKPQFAIQGLTLKIASELAQHCPQVDFIFVDDIFSASTSYNSLPPNLQRVTGLLELVPLANSLWGLITQSYDLLHAGEMLAVIGSPFKIIAFGSKSWDSRVVAIWEDMDVTICVNLIESWIQSGQNDSTIQSSANNSGVAELICSLRENKT